MIIPPFYSTPTEDEIVKHYETIAASITIPIMVYNNPATSNVDMRPELLARIAEIKGCDYVKESTLEVTRIAISSAGQGKMTPFGGILGFESFVMGAEGWVAVASNVAPSVMARIFTLAADEKRYDEARELYLKWLPIIQAVGGQLCCRLEGSSESYGICRRRSASSAPPVAISAGCRDEGIG